MGTATEGCGDGVFFVTLDRVEEGIAVLITDDGFQWHLPEAILPPGLDDGTVLLVRMTPDEDETALRTERLEETRRRLLSR